jgi:hypothetical protein
MLLAAAGATLFGLTWTDAVQTADSGELITAACRAGVPHPPGYPLFVLLGHAFCRLPLSSPAGRVGLLSVVAGVCAIIALYGCIVRLTGNRWAAALAALALATGQTFWRHTSYAEVFTLHAALCLGLVHVSLRMRACSDGRPRAKASLLVGLVFGLALANHHSSVFLFLFPLAAVLLPLRPARQAASRCGLGLVGLAAGLSPYLYLLFASPDHLPRWGDTSTWDGLLHHVLRRDYGTLSLALVGRAAPLDNLRHYVSLVPQQLGWVFSVAVLPGLAALVQRGRGRQLGQLALERRLPRDMAWALVITPVLAGPVFLLLFNLPPTGISAQVVERFHILPNALLALCLGVGLAVIDTTWLTPTVSPRRAKLWRGAAWAVVGLSALWSFPHANLRQSYAVEDYARNLLASAERNALVLGTGDAPLFTTLYAQEMLGLRRDIQYVDVQMLGHRWYVAQKRAERDSFSYLFRPRHIDTVSVIRAALERRVPVYLATAYSKGVVEAYRGYPVGPLFKVLPPGVRSPTPSQVENMNAELFRRFSRRGILPDPALDPWAASLVEAYARTWREIARGLHHFGDRDGAHRALERGRAWAPWLPAPDWIERLPAEPPFASPRIQ